MCIIVFLSLPHIHIDYAIRRRDSLITSLINSPCRVMKSGPWIHSRRVVSPAFAQALGSFRGFCRALAGGRARLGTVPLNLRLAWSWTMKAAAECTLISPEDVTVGRERAGRLFQQQVTARRGFLRSVVSSLECALLELRQPHLVWASHLPRKGLFFFFSISRRHGCKKTV